MSTIRERLEKGIEDVSHDVLYEEDGVAPLDERSDAIISGPESAMFSREELTGPPFEPPVIVDQYIPQDAGGLVAPGGTGKTTLALYESVHIVLGKSLYERKIVTPGAILFVTAEDSRKIIGSRLNRVMTDLGLDGPEKTIVRDNFFIEDFSAVSARLVSGTQQGQVVITPLVDKLIEEYAVSKISYCHLDPVSTLGPGETFGNDGMAEVMRAGRRIAAGLGCAVRWVHHVSKAVAREQTKDQYAARGGSAFADNSRFQHQLITINSRVIEFEGRNFLLPRQITDEQMESGDVTALLIHKLSYQKRERVPIFLVRQGFKFKHYIPVQTAHEAEFSSEARMERVTRLADFIKKRAGEGIKLTARALEVHRKELDMTRDQLRAAIEEGRQRGHLVERELPKTEQKGAKKTYLDTDSPPIAPLRNNAP